MRLKSILLLSRPVNLLIVGLTMYLTRYIVLPEVLLKGGIAALKLNHIYFSALVLSAVLITAAGNVINDYFDQRVDKINKPGRVIIGKEVDRKLAILIHQGFNLVALLLSFWVAWETGFRALIFLPLSICFLLWWYSPVFKKKPIIGNALVAVCTAMVPVFASITDLQLLQTELSAIPYADSTLLTYAWWWIFGIAAFAFVLTMIREAVKDAQDEPGDRSEHYQTIPILWGIQRTKRYVITWIIIFLLMCGASAYRMTNPYDLLWLAACLLFPVLMALYHVWSAKSPSDFGNVSRWIKVVMLGGLLLLTAILS